MAAIVLAALTLGALAARPALAQDNSVAVHPTVATHRPDGSIRVLTTAYKGAGSPWESWSVGDSWHGVGVYNTTATGQVAKADFQSNCCAEKHTFSISIRNRGTASDRFSVKATGSGLSGWSVTYFHGATNITSAVVAGTFKTPLLAVGSQFLITAKMAGTAASETLAGFRLVTATSVVDATKMDAVRFRLQYATWCYC